MCIYSMEYYSVTKKLWSYHIAGILMELEGKNILSEITQIQKNRILVLIHNSSVTCPDVVFNF